MQFVETKARAPPIQTQWSFVNTVDLVVDSMALFENKWYHKGKEK